MRRRYLIKENVLSVSTLCCKIFQVTILAYAMFLTQLLPKLTADFFDVSKQGVARKAGNKAYILLLPHWPAWMVIISLMAVRRRPPSAQTDLGVPRHRQCIEIRAMWDGFAQGTWSGTRSIRLTKQVHAIDKLQFRV